MLGDMLSGFKVGGDKVCLPVNPFSPTHQLTEAI